MTSISLNNRSRIHLIRHRSAARDRCISFFLFIFCYFDRRCIPVLSHDARLIARENASTTFEPQRDEGPSRRHVRKAETYNRLWPGIGLSNYSRPIEQLFPIPAKLFLRLVSRERILRARCAAFARNIFFLPLSPPARLLSLHINPSVTQISSRSAV